jgi:hypothetical protein
MAALSFAGLGANIVPLKQKRPKLVDQRRAPGGPDGDKAHVTVLLIDKASPKRSARPLSQWSIYTDIIFAMHR